MLQVHQHKGVLTKVSSNMAVKHIGSYQRLAGVRLTQMAQGCWSLEMHHLVVLLGMIRDGGGWDFSKDQNMLNCKS